MKNADVEKKISKSMIITGIVLVVMFLMVLIDKGYSNIHFSYPYMNNIMLVSSIVLLLGAAVCVVFGFIKNQKFLEFSAWCAGLATLSMLLKINQEAKALVSIAVENAVNKYALIKIALPQGLGFLGAITFVDLVQFGFFVYLVCLWIHTIYVIKKN